MSKPLEVVKNLNRKSVTNLEKFKDLMRIGVQIKQLKDHQKLLELELRDEDQAPTKLFNLVFDETLKVPFWQEVNPANNGK